MLWPVADHAHSLRCEARNGPIRRLRAKALGVALLLESSWSDGALIPDSAGCLLDRFDREGMLLLFYGGNACSRLPPSRGNLAVSSLATGRVSSGRPARGHSVFSS